MLSDQVEDVALIGRVVAGDADAFATLFRRRHGQIYRSAIHMTASPSTAEDVTQEVFLTVRSDAVRYDAGRAGRASVAAWLCGIARNRVRRRVERDRRLQPHAESDDGDEDERVAGRGVVLLHCGAHIHHPCGALVLGAWLIPARKNRP